jgi:hypothetical protein
MSVSGEMVVKNVLLCKPLEGLEVCGEQFTQSVHDLIWNAWSTKMNITRDENGKADPDMLEECSKHVKKTLDSLVAEIARSIDEIHDELAD